MNDTTSTDSRRQQQQRQQQPLELEYVPISIVDDQIEDDDNTDNQEYSNEQHYQVQQQQRYQQQSNHITTDSTYNEYSLITTVLNIFSSTLLHCIVHSIFTIFMALYGIVFCGIVLSLYFSDSNNNKYVLLLAYSGIILVCSMIVGCIVRSSPYTSNTRCNTRVVGRRIINISWILQSIHLIIFWCSYDYMKKNTNVFSKLLVKFLTILKKIPSTFLYLCVRYLFCNASFVALHFQVKCYASQVLL